MVNELTETERGRERRRRKEEEEEEEEEEEVIGMCILCGQSGSDVGETSAATKSENT